MNKAEATKLLTMINEGRVDDLKALLENTLTELRAKEVYGNGYAKAVKRVIKELKKMEKRRPILSYYDIQDGKQVFTDSYFAFRMNEGHYIEGLEHHNNNNGVYPSLDGIVPIPSPDCEVIIDMDQLVSPEKIVPMGKKEVPLYIAKTEHSTAYLNAGYVENAIQILGTEGLKMYLYGSMRPVLFTSPRGEAVVVPIRMN